MIGFINKTIHDPVANAIKGNPYAAIGAGALGLGGLGYLFLRGNQARGKADKAAKRYMDKYNDATKKNINRVRKLSDTKTLADYVTPSTMKAVFKDKDNAYFLPKDYAEALDSDERLKSNKKIDSKYGHIYYTDATKDLPTIAHEYGHASSAHKGQAPKRVGGAKLLALMLAGGLTTSAALRVLGLKYVPAVLAGSGVAAGLGYLHSSRALQEEQRATNNALKYLKGLNHSSDRMSENSVVLDKALDTYKEQRRRLAVQPFLLPLATMGLVGGTATLLANKGNSVGRAVKGVFGIT